MCLWELPAKPDLVGFQHLRWRLTGNFPAARNSKLLFCRKNGDACQVLDKATRCHSKKLLASEYGWVCLVGWTPGSMGKGWAGHWQGMGDMGPNAHFISAGTDRLPCAVCVLLKALSKIQFGWKMFSKFAETDISAKHFFSAVSEYFICSNSFSLPLQYECVPHNLLHYREFSWMPSNCNPMGTWKSTASTH